MWSDTLFRFQIENKINLQTIVIDSNNLYFCIVCKNTWSIIGLTELKSIIFMSLKTLDCVYVSSGESRMSYCDYSFQLLFYFSLMMMIVFMSSQVNVECKHPFLCTIFISHMSVQLTSSSSSRSLYTFSKLFYFILAQQHKTATTKHKRY